MPGTKCRTTRLLETASLPDSFAAFLNNRDSTPSMSIKRCPKRYLRFVCCLSNKKNTTKNSVRETAHNQVGTFCVALPAKIEAIITVIDQPLIVKRKLPILSTLSCSILYSSDKRLTRSLSADPDSRSGGSLVMFYPPASISSLEGTRNAARMKCLVSSESTFETPLKNYKFEHG